MGYEWDESVEVRWKKRLLECVCVEGWDGIRMAGAKIG